MIELNCDHRLHARLFPEEGFVEVSCRSRFCGKKPGVVVLHRFDIKTGELRETLKFKNTPKEVSNNGNRRRQGTPVRFA